MKKNYRIAGLCFSLFLTILLACTASDKPDTAANKAKPDKVLVNPNPFPFYKRMEIKPGYYFEVLSWGRGVDSVGAYLILMSDSVRQNYRSVSVERKGILVDAWNMDLDNDGNPEVYVQYLVRQNVNDLHVYEFSGNSFDKITFPGLNDRYKADFKGNDRFFVKNGGLFRSVPLVKKGEAKASEEKQVEYLLSGNRFSSQEK